MKKKQIRLTLETVILAAIATVLSLWMLHRLFAGATFAGAGCQQQGREIACQIIRNSGYGGGITDLLALATIAAGIYGTVQCLRRRRSGIIALMLFFGLQSFSLQLDSFCFYLPVVLNFYYQYSSDSFTVSVNLLMLVLFLNAIGRYRNDF